MITEARYQELIKIIHNARPLYINGEDTGISDEVYDSYMAQIYDYETVHQAAEDSPTRTVNPTPEGADVTHPIAMLSLTDVFSKEDAAAFLNKMKTEYGVTFSLEYKLDGLSVQLIYDGGKLISASTRGDGHVGVECLESAQYISSIPKTIESQAKVVVRGEVFMRKSRFKDYCDMYGGQANPRNTAAGIFKRKNERERASFLSFQAFSLENVNQISDADIPQRSGKEDLSSHSSCLNLLEYWGFETVTYWRLDDDQCLFNIIDEVSKNREEDDIPIDGMVLKINNLTTRDELGDNGVVPRWAVAYKFPAKEKETRLLRIDFQVGSTGKLTPVAILEPVLVDGSTISRCTLHNRKRIEDLHIQIGDMVTIYKAGDIIPAIKSCRHTEQSVPVEFPTVCPACGSPLNNEVCDNLECSEKLKARLNNWVSKGVANFKGVAGSLIDTLFERGVIRTPADFYTKVTPATFLTIPKMGPAKKATYFRVVEESKKNTSFAQLLVGIGIDGLSYAGAENIKNEFEAFEMRRNWKEALDTMLGWSEEQFTKLLGQSKGSSMYRQIQNEFMQKLIRDLGDVFQARTI
jgi:DNA ligase (NAD+)